jgi:hypothetical protein
MFKIITMLGLVLIYPSLVTATNIQLDMASLVDDLMETSDGIKTKINLSGKQRMLTQRMTKLALLISLNINKDKNKKSLMTFANLYNDTLEGFKGKDDKAIDAQIVVIEKAWKPFFKNVKTVVDGKDKDGKALDYLIGNNEALLKESNILVSKYEEGNKSQNYMEKAMVSIINLAGRQRMLTQKMTKEKLLAENGKSEYKDKLHKTIELFDKSLKNLTNGNLKENILKPTNDKIIKQLNTVNKIWNRLKPLYEKDNLSKRELNILIKKNPILLKEMNTMVKMAEVEMEY